MTIFAHARENVDNSIILSILGGNVNRKRAKNSKNDENTVLGGGKLAVVQRCIKAVCREKCFMTSLFDDVTVLHYENHVRFLDGGETVGDDEGSPSLHHGFEGVLNFKLGSGIDR